MSSIYVRAFNPDDVYLINKWRNDPEIQKYTGGIDRKVSIELDKEWLRQKMMNDYHEIYWAICANDGSEKMVGYTSLNSINYVNRVVEGGGIVIGDVEYRDGLCLFETMLIKLDYAFNTLNMNKYCAAALENHKISNPLLKALLFKEEGIFRQHVYKYGEYHDIIRYAILKEEYNENVNAGEYREPVMIRRFVRLAKAGG